MRRQPRLNQPIALLIAVALSLVPNLNVKAIGADATGSQSPAAVAGSNDIESLEKRFFEHTYAKDGMDQRLERLEKMVFGEVRPGSDQERLANLLAAVPAEPSEPAENSTAQAAPNAQNAPAQTTTTADSTDTAGSESDSSDYPTVTNLETEILGKSYPKKGIRQRLSALEIKAFGAVSTSDDLSDRVTLLQRYASEHNLGAPPSYSSTYPAVSSSNASPPPTAAPAANSPLEAKVAWLERQVYGSANTGKPLINRVKRLDRTLVPDEHLDTTESLPDNVNTLINSYQLTHNPAGPKAGGVQFANKSINTAPDNSSTTPYNYDSGSSPYGQPSATPYGTTATQPYTPSADYTGQNNAYQAQNNAYQAQNPGIQSQTTPYQPQASYGYQSANSNLPSQTSAPTQHHSLIHGLAKVLGAVGSMTMGGIGYGGMGGYGMGMPGMGYGGYGMPGMGYGGYGMPGMGYGMPGMGYGMGGFPGFHY